MIYQITRETKLPTGLSFEDLFEELDFVEISYDNLIQSNTFCRRSIVKISSKFFKDFFYDLEILESEKDLWDSLTGYWETNDYYWDYNEGFNLQEITELNRVEQKERIIKETYWELLNL